MTQTEQIAGTFRSENGDTYTITPAASDGWVCVVNVSQGTMKTIRPAADIAQNIADGSLVSVTDFYDMRACIHGRTIDERCPECIQPTAQQIHDATMDLRIAAQHLIDAKIQHAQGRHADGIETARSTRRRLEHASRVLGSTLADVYALMDEEHAARCKHYPAVAALFA